MRILLWKNEKFLILITSSNEQYSVDKISSRNWFLIHVSKFAFRLIEIWYNYDRVNKKEKKIICR